MILHEVDGPRSLFPEGPGSLSYLRGEGNKATILYPYFQIVTISTQITDFPPFQPHLVEIHRPGLILNHLHHLKFLFLFKFNLFL